MRKRIIIILVIIVALSGAWYFYTKSKTVTTEEQTSGFKSFFPFGNNTQSNSPDGTLSQDNQTGDTASSTQNKSLFKQITPHTVAGYDLFLSTTTTTTPSSTPKGKPTTQTTIDHMLRYVSRNSGYVYEVKNNGTPIQVTNIFIANIYETLFADGGKTAILRFLRDDAKTIATYIVPVPERNIDGTRTQKNGAYLPDDISNISVSPDGSTIARLTNNGSTTSLYSTNTANNNKRELLRSPFHEWLISWGGKDIYLQTKASGLAEGFLYKVDGTTRRLIKILGNINGLTTSVSPNGTYVLYSTSNSLGFSTKILTLKTGDIRNIANSILPEKCAWLKSEDLICAGGGDVPGGTYPDAWYAGTVKLSDKIFRIYTSSNLLDVLYTPTENESFDMTNLQVDEDSNLLYFIDKQTGLLWQFTL